MGNAVIVTRLTDLGALRWVALYLTVQISRFDVTYRARIPQLEQHSERG